jgi:hypothetical protein
MNIIATQKTNGIDLSHNMQLSNRATGGASVTTSYVPKAYVGLRTEARLTFPKVAQSTILNLYQVYRNVWDLQKSDSIQIIAQNISNTPAS